jgi:hypothetical protein
MSSGYRLAPALAARLVGLLLVGLASLLLVVTLVMALTGGPVGAVLVVAALAAVAVVVVALLLRNRLRVVELDDVGYRVRLVRGAGVRVARWRDVEDAVAASPRGVDCIVLRLRDGRTTSIPLVAVDATREDFVEDLRAHLRRGEGLRAL